MKLLDNLFKRNKKEENRRIHDDDIVDIPVYGPHDSILPVPYEASSFFARFEASFEGLCRDFLNKTELDKYSKGYMDSLIDQMVEETLDLLAVQEIGHRSVIDQLMRTRSSDINDAEIRLGQIAPEKEAVRTEIRKLEEIYYSGTSLEVASGLNGGDA